MMPSERTGAKGAVVLKVGGSLAQSDAAARLMRGVSTRRPDRLLIVPGGAAFADAVRKAQAQHGLSEQASHHMALLAMHQYGVLLADLAPGFALAEAPAQFETAWRAGLTPIWLPAAMVSAAPDVPCSWDVTSDSLAAWVAARIDATRLVLVKSCALPARPQDARCLAAAGIVDGGFAAYVESRRFSWTVVSGTEAALATLA